MYFTNKKEGREGGREKKELEKWVRQMENYNYIEKSVSRKGMRTKTRRLQSDGQVRGGKARSRKTS